MSDLPVISSNPLPAFSTKELAAELTRRGYRVESPEQSNLPLTGDLSFRELRGRNSRRCELDFKHTRDSETWRLVDWTNAICGEAGELANVAKKIKRGDFSQNSAITELSDEIADVVIYCDLAAWFIGVELADAIRLKFNSVSRRIGSPTRL
jgi:NTP pyrophosphatase (non-canonical NTP hydrolase)